MKNEESTNGVTIQRSPRSSEDRKESSRPSDAWLPSSSLPVPTPRDGFEYRWIRTSAHGKADNTNVSRKFREGWVAEKAADHANLQLMSDINSHFKGNLEVGGLLLCSCPTEILDQRRAHFGKLAATQMAAVDNSYMNEQDPRMPLSIERSTKVNKFREG